jgi:hypothetical protein
MLKGSLVRSIAAVLVVSSVLAPVAPALAQEVRESQELKLLESVVAASGEKSTQARQLMIETALSAYVAEAQGRSEKDRTQGFADAAELLGLGAQSFAEVSSVTQDAVAGGKNLLVDAAFKKNLARALSKIQLPRGAQFDSWSDRCEKLEQVMNWGVILGAVSGLVALTAHATAPCLEWVDGYYGNWCGFSYSGRYFCDFGYFAGYCRKYGVADPEENARLAPVRTTATVVAVASIAAAIWGYSDYNHNCR